jgi:hypothetical protein
MTRRMLNLLTVLSLLLCVAACADSVRIGGGSRVLVRHDFGRRAARVEVSKGNLYVHGEVTGPERYVYPQVFVQRGFAGFTYGRGTLGSWAGVPVWFVTLVLAGIGLSSWRLARRRRAPGLCRACGYDLRATPGRCPECGRVP